MLPLNYLNNMKQCQAANLKTINMNLITSNVKDTLRYLPIFFYLLHRSYL